MKVKDQEGPTRLFEIFALKVGSKRYKLSDPSQDNTQYSTFFCYLGEEMQHYI